MKIHKLPNKMHTEVYEWDQEDLKRSREDLGIDIFDYAKELTAAEDGTIPANDISKIMVYDGRAYSLEADHGNYSELPHNHPINRITDKDPAIILADDVKNSTLIKAFRNPQQFAAFVNDKIVSLLKERRKKIHREVSARDTGKARVSHIHICEINQNERICYTVYFNLTYNKIFVLIAYYFAHNTGAKSRGGKNEMKENPSEAEFIRISNTKTFWLTYLNRRYSKGEWQNV
jgi:hypothetical protein